MRLLLDTNALLFWLARTLDPSVAKTVADPGNEVVVSVISVWEIGIQRAVGKLESPGDLAEVVVASGFQPLSVTMEHAHRAGALPRHHRDPFDRMLIAQAQIEGLTIVTRDRDFQDYDVVTMPC